MASFIPIAIAHDSVCKRGCEWLFKVFGLSKQKDAICKSDVPSPMSREMKDALDKDLEEFKTLNRQ